MKEYLFSNPSPKHMKLKRLNSDCGLVFWPNRSDNMRFFGNSNILVVKKRKLCP